MQYKDLTFLEKFFYFWNYLWGGVQLKKKSTFVEFRKAIGLQTLREKSTAISQLCAGSFFDNKIILEIGCGQAAVFSSLEFSKIKLGIGLDVAPDISFAPDFLKQTNPNLLEKVLFLKADGLKIPAQTSSVDVVVNYDVFEHLSNPSEIFSEIRRVLKPGGLLVVIFGPPWFHAYGAHLFEMMKAPWLHLMFSEKTWCRMGTYLKNDGSEIKSFKGGFNKMSVKKCKKTIKKSGLEIVRFDVEYTKNIKFLKYIPFLNELFAARVKFILQKS